MWQFFDLVTLLGNMSNIRGVPITLNQSSFSGKTYMSINFKTQIIKPKTKNRVE